MKKTLLPLTAALYLSDVLFIILGCIDVDWLAYLYLAMIPVILILAVLNIVCAIANRKTTLRSSVKNALIFKLILIPHYIMSFVVGIILVIVGIFSAFTIFWLASLPVLLLVFLFCLFTYFVMVSTGTYTVVSLLRERKELNLPFVVINIVCQFIFVLDLISTAYLLYYIKNNP